MYGCIMRLLKWAVLFQMMKVEIDEQLMKKTSLEDRWKYF
jgi:hypothetical protein